MARLSVPRRNVGRFERPQPSCASARWLPNHHKYSHIFDANVAISTHAVGMIAMPRYGGNRLTPELRGPSCSVATRLRSQRDHAMGHAMNCSDRMLSAQVRPVPVRLAVFPSRRGRSSRDRFGGPALWANLPALAAMFTSGRIRNQLPDPVRQCFHRN